MPKRIYIPIIIACVIAGGSFWAFKFSKPAINPWAWEVTYSQSHGIWNVICDTQMINQQQLDRCYLRWVDVYAQRPKFGALFIFIVADVDKLSVELHPEPGTTFTSTGFQITDDQQATWQMSRSDCLIKANCKLYPKEIPTFLQAAKQGQVMTFSFTDKYTRQYDLAWPLEGFAEAITDLSAQAELRQATLTSQH